MRNIILFIRRFSNFFFFLVLQIVALSFLFRFNHYHQAVFMNIAGEVTGRVGEKYNTVEYYFKLKRTNEALVQENTRLRNMLRQDYQAPDTARKIVVDSIRIDSLASFQRFRYYSAKVVNGTVNMPNNYFTIHRGTSQGLQRGKEWGVISPQGIAGRLVSVGNNFSVVMSVLNRQFKVSAALKKGSDPGSVMWDGSSPRFLTLINIPKSVPVSKGDTVVTSTLSGIYPPGIMIGTVADISAESGSNFYTLKIKTATNFLSLEYVYLIEDLQKEEQDKIEEPFKKSP